MEQLNIFDYIEKSADVNVVVQKAPEKAPRTLTQYETWERNTSSGYVNSISNRVDVVDSWLTGEGE